MRKSPRQRRLEADYRSIEKLDAESSIFSFTSSGNPAHRYCLKFEGPGISRSPDGKVHIVHQHEIIVELGAAYPRLVPNLLWRTPIFHPNVSNNGVICLGGYGTHWVPSLTLDEMSTMLWDMLRFENFDIDSPYNRDAAIWARDQLIYKFPLDNRDIRDRINDPVFEAEEISETEPSTIGLPKKKKRTLLGFLERVRSRGSAGDSPATENESAHVVAEVNEPAEAAGEIEIIETGISFVEPELENSQSQPQSSEDTGIIFLD